MVDSQPIGRQAAAQASDSDSSYQTPEVDSDFANQLEQQHHNATMGGNHLS